MADRTSRLRRALAGEAPTTSPGTPPQGPAGASSTSGSDTIQLRAARMERDKALAVLARVRDLARAVLAELDGTQAPAPAATQATEPATRAGDRPTGPEATAVRATAPAIDDALKQAACSAYRPPTEPAESGVCAHCGMYDYKHQADAGAEAAERRARQLADILTTCLNAYPAAPDGADVLSRPVPARLLEQWRSTLNQPGEAP